MGLRLTLKTAAGLKENLPGQSPYRALTELSMNVIFHVRRSIVNISKAGWKFVGLSTNTQQQAGFGFLKRSLGRGSWVL